MADKNLSRDESVLRKMLEHIDSIQEAVAYLKCDTPEKFTANNTSARICRDACTNNVMQIGELSKQLTDQSIKSIGILSGGTLITVRNNIAHKYRQINFHVVFAFMRECCSKKTKQEIIQRIKYCHENKRNK